ncbi:hypothetical protein ACOSQ2_032687 [Xanthoceras sorbifolium]
MAETTLDSAHEPIPGTPGIREVRPEPGSESFGFCTTEMGGGGGGVDRSFGIRKVGLRAEIDTSPPFGSVKEAVTRFGGSGPWLPLYKLGDGYNGVDEEFDIKRVEEQAAELEKDLIVKELETLDVLEELGTTKKIVEELKLQIQREALKCMATPDYQQISTPVIKEMNKEHHQRNRVSHFEQIMVGNSSPVTCPVSSPDLILMELKQAKLNLGRTINDLGVIQTSVESLNKKMKKEKKLLEKTRAEKPRVVTRDERNVGSKSSTRAGEQFKKLAEISRAMLGNEQKSNNKACMMKRTAEMRWLAAKKMEEAAKAAEALAFAEIKALSSSSTESTSGFSLREPEKIKKWEDLSNKNNVVRAMEQIDESGISKLTIQKMLEEAAAEVKCSKQALEEALNRIEIADRKQLAAGEALRRWTPPPDYDDHTKELSSSTSTSTHEAILYSPAATPRLNIFHPSDYHHDPLNHVLLNKSNESSSKPVLRPTVSMRDILSRKQVIPEECVVRRQTEGQTERRKVALSQMLQELREDLTFNPRKAEHDQCGDDDDHHHQKHPFAAQRRKFGFIHISLPLTKQSKKKM